jgi:hypothetical protein
MVVMSLQLFAATQSGSAMLVMGLLFAVGLIPLIGVMIFKK